MAAIAALGAAAFACASWTLPTPLVLPAFSIFAVAAASLVAAVAWAAARLPATERVTYWDVAGALTFIGICAALLSDPDQVIPLLETRRPEQTAGLN